MITPLAATVTLTIPAPRRLTAQQLRKPRSSANRPRLSRKRVVLTLLLCLSALIAHYNVDRTLTADDRHYIQLMLPGVAEGSGHQASFPAQLALVHRCQQAVRARAPRYVGIPEGQPREPKELYLRRQGICYDRSRVLEKMFLYLGLETRHVSLFEREPETNAFTTLLFHHVHSHAVSEVLTSRGWMIVDSNIPWLGLDRQHRPVSVRQMAARYR